MYERGARIDNIFCEKSWYLLPCFCVKENNIRQLLFGRTREQEKWDLLKN